MATIYGTTDADTRNGTAGNDTIFGWATGGNASSASGNDTLDGGAGKDSILGGTANDNLYGGLGIDTLIGGTGSDNLRGDGGSDKLFGEAGNDSLNGGNGYDALDGGTGNDILYGEAGNDRLNGGAGIDTLIGGTGDDSYIIDSTADTIIELFNQGYDSVESSVSYTLGESVESLELIGNDAINGTGNSFSNTISGNTANNILEGKEGNDYLVGNSGNDTLIGGTGDDLYSIRNFSLFGEGSVPDTIFEDLNAGIDTVEIDGFDNYTLGDNLENLTIIQRGSNPLTTEGNALDNVIFHSYGFSIDSPINGYAFGDAGNDSLYGGGYLNLDGGTGNDTLFAGFYYDTLTGGVGADNFSFGSPSFGDFFAGTHTITDFVVADDTITVNGNSSIFDGGLTVGAVITAAQFRIGSAAVDSSERFIYNGTTGGLFFDTDGTGASAQVQFAQLSTGLAMTNNDIFVIA